MTGKRAHQNNGCLEDPDIQEILYGILCTARLKNPFCCSATSLSFELHLASIWRGQVEVLAGKLLQIFHACIFPQQLVGGGYVCESNV